MRVRFGAALAIVSWFSIGAPAWAGDAPDSEVNPATGYIESVDSVFNGPSQDVRHTVDTGQGAPRAVLLLTSAAEDDLGPRIATTSAGAAKVVWWREAAVDTVLHRGRDAAGTWSGETVVSSPGESSRNPEVVFHDGKTWIAYELDASGGTAVGVIGIEDTPDPFGRTLLGTSVLSGSLGIQIRSESARLWVTWTYDGSRIGWSEYQPDACTWSPAQLESYASDGIEAARARVRERVLAP
jgi:hypothetical protein